MSMQTPPSAFHPPVGPPPGWRPMPQRMVRDAGAPLALLIVAGILAGLLTAVSAVISPGAFLIGMIPSAFALAVGVAAYLWLDRWEPEPPRLLVLAFLWGGGIATIGALAIGLVLGLSGLIPNEFVDAAIQAPLVEEFCKGAFLLIMLTGVRRREMVTLVDHLVYAGMVGLGFAFVENLLYFSSSESLEETAYMAIVRTGFKIFGHPLYTSMIGLGIYWARRQPGRINWSLVLLGYLAGALLHGLWNGAATALGLGGIVVVYVVMLVPAFIALVRLGMNSRRREGEIVARYLPGMVHAGLIDPQEAAWIANLQGRASRREQLRALPAGRQHVNRLVDAVTELAFVRDRMDTGPYDPALPAQLNELVAAIVGERQLVAAPLGQLAAPMAPLPPQPQGFPVAPAPYQGWTPPRAAQPGWPPQQGPAAQQGWTPPAQPPPGWRP